MPAQMQTPRSVATRRRRHFEDPQPAPPINRHVQVEPKPRPPTLATHPKADRLCEELSRRIGSHKYGMWFGHTRLAVDDGRLTVQTVNQFVADWIRSHFIDELREVGSEMISPDVQIDICVSTDLNGHATPDGCETSHGHAPGPPQAAATAEPRCKSAPRKVRTDFRRLEDFVVGASNRMAFAEACRLVDEPDVRRVSPLFIHGECGLGKTHLLQGICQRFIERTGRVPHVRYVNGEQFTNEYITAIRNNTLDAFRQKHRKLDLLAIDDVHFLSNKVKTQTEFLYTLDAIDLSGARVVLASDNHPHHIKRFSQSLVSRFLSGMVVEIGKPDLALRKELIQRLATGRGLRLTPEAVELLAERCLGSVRELEGALTKLAAYRSLLQSNGDGGAASNGHAASGEIGLMLAEQLFREQPWQANHTVRLPHLVDVICNRLNVARGDVLGSGRHRRIVLARGLIAYLGRELTTHSFPEIAQALGRKNHSTIHTAHHRLREQVANNDPVELGGGEQPLLVKELIDQVRRAVKERKA